MAKVRVYELAKELGVESKTLLSHLKEQGEFVRSASSTIEPPVVRKVRESFPAQQAAGGGPATDAKEAAAKPAARKPEAKPAPAAPAAPLTPAASAPVAALAAAAPAAPATPPAEAPVAASEGVPRAPSRPVAPSPRAPAPRAPAAKTPAPRAPAAKTPVPRAPAAAAPEAPAAREGGVDTPRSSPRPGAPRPGNNPFAPSQGMPRGGREGREPREAPSEQVS